MSDQPKAFDWRIIGKLFSLGKPYTLTLLVALAALAMATLGELYLPVLLRDTIDMVLAPSAGESVRPLLAQNALLYLGLLLLTMGGGFIQVYLLATVSQKVMAHLRDKLYAHLLGQSQAWMQNQQVGKLVSALTSDVGTISDFLNTLFSGLLRDIALMVGVIAVLFQLHTELAWVTVATLPPVLILITLFRVRSRSAYRKMRAAVGRLNSFLNERFSGMSIIQLFVQEERTRTEFEEENQNALKASLGEMYVNATFRPLIDLLFSVSLGILLWVGAGWALEGFLTVGALIAYVNLLRLFYQPVGDFAENFSLMQSAMAGAERVFRFLGENRAMPDNGTEEFPGENVDIAFRDVVFGYNPEETVLKGLDFSVPAGATAALVGYTGAGKTTITSLLSRFWDPQSGSILAAGKPLTTYSLPSLRRGIQGVLQDVQLFSGTVRENVSLGREFPQESLDEAARRSRLDKVLARLDHGWDTVLSENGSNLSAGERQLVSFARVLVQDPAVLILDEATANIDTETEHWIQEALTELLENRTSLVIAHRLSTIRHADIILVLDQGRIAESGTHDELMALKAFYWNLYRLQYEKA